MIERADDRAFVARFPERAPGLVEAVGFARDLPQQLLVGARRLHAVLIGRRRHRRVQRPQRRFRARGGRRRRLRRAVEERARVVDRHREVQPLALPKAGGVDPDGRAGPIQKRTSAIARVEGRIGLHELRGADAPHAAHDSARDRVLQHPERRSDRDDFLTGARAGERAERNRGLIG